MYARITQALTALALLPLLISSGQLVSVQQPTPAIQCHYEADISGTYRRRDGSTFEAPIGRIVVSACSSPEDLVRRVEELAGAVRMQATAQAAR